MGQELAFFTEAKARDLLEVVRRQCGAPASLSALDVGCGIGATDEYLSGAFRQLCGVDVSQGVVDTAARANPSVRYDMYDGETLPYDDGTFDVTFAICVLHHVEPADRQRFVGELGRVTREGGVVLLFEHNPYNPLTRMAVHRCEFDRGVVLLRATAARRLLVTAGLHVQEQRYIIFFPWRHRALRVLERRLSRFPLGAQYLVAAKP